MASRKLMKSVLRGFLGTYTSRYTELDGYWLFGLLVESLEVMTIDLLNPVVPTATPAAVAATKLAADKFADQMQKAGIPSPLVGAAVLVIRKDNLGWRSFAGRPRPVSGFEVSFTVSATMDTGRVYSDRVRELVVPQTSGLFGRSGRARVDRTEQG
jgi:hypothetical protein